MSTHPLPAGSCNFPVNLPKGLRAALGRLATLTGARSLGSWIRGILSIEVTGWRSHVQSGAAEICAMDAEGELLFATIAADGRITPDEAEDFRAYQRRERALDEQHSALAHLQPVDLPAGVLDSVRAEMDRTLGRMGAAPKGVAS